VQQLFDLYSCSTVLADQ